MKQVKKEHAGKFICLTCALEEMLKKDFAGRTEGEAAAELAVWLERIDRDEMMAGETVVSTSPALMAALDEDLKTLREMAGLNYSALKIGLQSLQ